MTHLTHNKLVVCFLVLFGLGVHIALPASNAQTSVAQPVLLNAIPSSIAPGTIEVAGEGFTAGGLVYITLDDEWGTTLRQDRWTTASPTVYGAHGSQDPAQGFTAGGDIEESFPPFRQTAFGPNGSQDPARGYVAGDGQMTPPAGACDGPLVVRALDQRTASWSNLLDVEPGC